MAIINQRLIDAAIATAIERWPIGEADAAALYTANGRILTSVFADSPLDSARLCHETGAICEAHKLNEPVIASACVHRDNELASFVVLPPCGLCMERLAYWGRGVEVAVPSAVGEPIWVSKRLDELQPFYWRDGWSDGGQGV